MFIAKRVLSLLLTASLMVVSWFAVFHTQDIIDWWRLRDYTPSPLIASLADDTTMTDEGQKLFYVYDPAVVDKAAFQQDCTVGEVTIVLGCYVPQQGLYIYDVTDDRLAGVEQVTAAHEMLHVAYERLSAKERARIDDLLVQAFNALDNDRIKENVATYRSRDPSVVNDELHSIIGTEVRDLPDELETYYRQYFTNRAAIVTYAEAYASAFTEREQQIAAYDAQLSDLNAQIEAQQTQLTYQAAALEQERASLERISDAATFNAAIEPYNAKVDAYNSGVQSLQSKVNEYNDIVAARNAIAVEERDLVNAIDTRVEEL